MTAIKFIHLSDPHVINGDRLLYGANPARRLAHAVDDINAEHGDAAFVVITGDLTHWGDSASYADCADAIARLNMPVHLLPGNHDDHTGFARYFPQVPRDPNGYIQYSFQTPFGTGLCLDTTAPGSDAGTFCATRRAWLRAELEATQGPVLLFMHHPPFEVGIPAMDALCMSEAEAFHEVIAPHAWRIRHLFFGHLHRALYGNWRGISFSCMRGLNHQVALDMGQPAHGGLGGNLGGPAYGVVLMSEDCVTVHFNDYADASPRFNLAPPPGTDIDAHAMIMRHPGFEDIGPPDPADLV